MDPRQPQHPFSRPPERPLIHNPNHQTPSQSPQTQSYSSYPPPASQPQPPVHVPFTTDPYSSSRRDPFFPTAAQQHARRSSYGMHGGDAAPPAQGERHGGWGNTAGLHASHPHAQSGPPPPPSMSSSHNSSSQPPYGYEAPRRPSLGGGSPSNPYGAPSHDPPPPPPSFSRPHMPPPSSPQQQHNHAPPSQPPRPPFSSSFGGGRELPGLGAAHRPGSSMSISSLIGAGDTASNQQSQSQSSPTTAPSNAPLSNNHTMQPPSPRRGLSSGSRSDFQPYRLQSSPEDRHMYGSTTSRLSEVHGYPTGSPTRPYSNHGSPEQGRQPLPQTSQPYKPMVFQSSRSYASTPSDAQARDPRQASTSVPPRPNSQPTGPPGTSDHEAKPSYDALGGRRTTYQQPEERRRTLGESHHTRPNTAEILGGNSQAGTHRDRPVTVQPVSHSAFSPPRDPRGVSLASQAPRNLWRQAVPEDAPRETTEGRREEPAPYRGYNYPASSQAPAPFGPHAGEDMVRGRSLDHLSHRAVEQYHAPPTSDPQTNERQKAEHLSRSLSSGGLGYSGRSIYDQPRRMGEDLQHSKVLLALGPEANRRTGRASPLPQAVQGAQAQPLSIGKDPSIKSEFGRMFSGLGSGLGTNTPSRQSPMPQNGPEILPPGADSNDSRLQRVSSQTGRKPKRVKDEEGLVDNESGDGRGTPALGGVRGTKRNKYTHPGHHHHHHTHAHHHHHHHHKPEEDLAIVAAPAASTPLNQRYPSLPQNGATPQPSHHHHHYHAAPHHHHHAPRLTQAAPLPSPKLPPKVHDIQPVLDEAAKYPRAHLGSYVYEATPVLPQPNSALDDQFSFASKPKPLSQLEFPRNPVNCTIDVRVPRYYLKPRQRQQIVLQHHLWGACVYRDDSDVIAAAIHSGWIRGEWDDTVDINMLDPRITAPNDANDAEETLERRPAAPVPPPADIEAHIRLLILPRIEKYVGTVEYGISSRKSSNHDGLSFMIHQIRWVEEGYGSRGQERNAAAMKRRLDSARTLLSLGHGGDNSLRRVNGTTKLNA
ncbi:Rxt3-domain-containing protein [Lindgomyces ingoldianus]|uniref:Rxt3-domain-containing protein n=1 Tax=Lindgomyces ingoldianus TaxID=673940 RepID=A0ACB6QFP9_9PLEO|nr:Rxt3-domain-containing protein [Lindgomyces ingoldianus]KAF2464961.1 Rxt3-domain-containing protein [Lindgomyces ingoldianus]